ncbi:uncharacterized protein LOC122076782 isoform X2 [Macadamia integrifolia]|uniref:uncharacterized protein LOC122076782 isoform X2 n=1 Tax=Macadamia integrifolia TaxID=60698 RepID=UPI001C4FC00D|nr:uncharacterized protein LOC122076782 isoform X2 [Macadamia integrifolia]
MESGHVNGSRKHLKTYTVATIGESDISAPDESANSPSSSSSSNTSLDDFFCVDGSHGTKLEEDALLATKGVSSDRSPKSLESSDQGSQSDTFPIEVTVISPDSSLDGLSVTQSPPIQVMGRSVEPDPYRIPSSVFARSKSTTPMEWSVASNESLFSIHVGNNSFSRDHIFLMGRSGELGKSGELINFPDFPISPPPVMDGDKKTYNDVKKSTELRGGLGVTEAAAETVKEVLRVTAEDRNRQKTTPADGVHYSSSHSHRSDGSGASISSFAFPILTGEGGRRSSDSGKADSEQQTLKQPQPKPKPQPQPETPASTPNARGGKWFPCFSCCPFCC